MVWRVASGAGSTTSGHTSGPQSSLTTWLFLPGSSQADRSTPSPTKLSLDRPELGSNPNALCSASAASSLLSSRHTKTKSSPVVSRDLHKRLFLKIKQAFMDGH